MPKITPYDTLCIGIPRVGSVCIGPLRAHAFSNCEPVVFADTLCFNV
jgi:hypothetical protein